MTICLVARCPARGDDMDYIKTYGIEGTINSIELKSFKNDVIAFRVGDNKLKIPFDGDTLRMFIASFFNIRWLEKNGLQLHELDSEDIFCYYLDNFIVHFGVTVIDPSINQIYLLSNLAIHVSGELKDRQLLIEISELKSKVYIYKVIVNCKMYKH